MLGAYEDAHGCAPYLDGDAAAYPISATLREAIGQGSMVAVLGYGVSNRPLTDILVGLGARVVVYDQKPLAALGERAAVLAAGGVRFVTQEDEWVACSPALIFRSPGIRPDIPAIRRAMAAGARLAGEMDWFLERTPATVIAITGSDGKSTTTTMTARMLETAYAADGARRVFLGGNLGTPLLPLLPQMRETDFAVVELSSFQLSVPMRAPHRAAITNITPNHLNWHTNMAEYIAAKRTVCDISRPTRLITNASCEITRALAADYAAAGGETVLFSIEGEALSTHAADTVCCEEGCVVYRTANGVREHILPADELLLPGRHNLENFMTACALVHGLADAAAMAKVGRRFGGVEHRLERVRTLDGITFYNSSIDSTPTRTAAALSALPPRSCVVICGGYDKNIPFDALADALYERAGAVVLTGATRDKILRALTAHPACDERRLCIRVCPDFAEAVAQAAAFAAAGYGENVLLSPACASFDAFANFEERGRVFREQVMRMTALTVASKEKENQE